MVAFKVNLFGGMIPAFADELIPDNAATHSVNAWLYSGNLVGLPALRRLFPSNAPDLLDPTTTKVYRIPVDYARSTYLFDSIWMQFSDINTDVVRAPVFDDVHDRYYWAPSPNGPMYNTRARIEAGLIPDTFEEEFGPWRLGINPPGIAPTLVVVGGPVRLEDVRVATTTQGVLNADYVTGKTVDGVVLKKDDRIFVKNGVTGANGHASNGIRVVADGVGGPPALATPPRATDMDTSNEFVGKYFKVLEGTANAGTFWKITNVTAPVLGTDPITSEEAAALPVTVTRAYVVTWVTVYGEESAPSPPVVATGAQDGVWNLTNLPNPAPLDQFATLNAVRAITHIRIYRTITSSSGVATFFMVDEIPCTQDTYDDSKTDDEVSQNAMLQSYSWTPPPVDLQGLTVMWNGMVAGFRKNELWICEPYRPHAWPVPYVLTMEYPIVGLGVANQLLVVCTSGNPVTVNGAVPSNLNAMKIPKFEPCTSRGSILSSPGGVVYASPNGIVMCGQGDAVVATKELLTRDKWWKHAQEARLRAAWLGEAYYAFGSISPGFVQLGTLLNDDPETPDPNNPPAWSDPFNDPTAERWVQEEDFSKASEGILVDIANQRVAFNLLTSNDVAVTNVQNDLWSGELLSIRDGVVYWLSLQDDNPVVEPVLWRSKVMQTLDKRNLGAMRIFFKPTEGLPVLNPQRNNALEQTLGPNQWGLCRVYADGRLVQTRELRVSGELWKLPSGFLADYWQYEVETRLKILSIQTASSAKELASV